MCRYVDAAGSTLEAQYPWLVVSTGGSKYLKLSGSSMATGVVSGLVAIMLEANQYAAYSRWEASTRTTPYVPPPPVTSNAAKAMLQFTATPLKDANRRRLRRADAGHRSCQRARRVRMLPLPMLQ